MGAINWMLNDVWPGVTNATLDYLDSPKVAHDLHRQCMNPVLANGKTDAKRGAVEIHLTCDCHPYQRGVLRWTLVHVDGRTLAAGERQVELPQFQSRRIMELELRAQIAAFGVRNLLLFLETLDGHGVLLGDNVLAWCPWTHLNLQPAAIAVRQHGNRVEISADKPALWAWLPQPQAGGMLQDNVVHLRPGLARMLVLSPPDEYRELTPKSLKDTY
ncbi:MAG: hypothetical protein BWZ02_01581 [Lentisphaerae bacterium ADurb.BinA184]|nr:MAG: hypothetical protein BWZ02_01581 [Lentisphaerae bacterium ADurb.BinA184]